MIPFTAVFDSVGFGLIEAAGEIMKWSLCFESDRSNSLTTQAFRVHPSIPLTD